MKRIPAAVIILTVALSIGVQAQKPTQVDRIPQPAVDRIPPRGEVEPVPRITDLERIRPYSKSSTVPKTAATPVVEYAPVTIALLPDIQQEAVYINLNNALDVMKNRVGEKTVMGTGLEKAKTDVEKLSGRKERGVPKLLLWTLNGDASLIRQYAATGDEVYARAAFKHLNSVAAVAQDTEDEATVTVVTVDNEGKPKDGFQICYLPAEWIGLNIQPTVFPAPSGSSEKLPKANWAFWSRDFQDSKRVGNTTSKTIDKDQSLSIGIPR